MCVYGCLLLVVQATLKSSGESGVVEMDRESGDVVEVEWLLKRLDTFVRLLDPLQQRIQQLDNNAQQLAQAKHMETDNIRQSNWLLQCSFILAVFECFEEESCSSFYGRDSDALYRV